jgi:hypothetical protein
MEFDLQDVQNIWQKIIEEYIAIGDHLIKMENYMHEVSSKIQ